jgi:hypothetical protein
MSFPYKKKLNKASIIEISDCLEFIVLSLSINVTRKLTLNFIMNMWCNV